MDDRDFLDRIYQLWSKTTWADIAYWKYEDDHTIEATSERGDIFVADVAKPEDAEFITAIHGCLPDLVRRVTDSLDEADRLDYATDELHGEVATLCRENEDLIEAVEGWEQRVSELEAKLSDERAYVDSLEVDKADLRDEIEDLHDTIRQLEREIKIAF